MKHIILVKDKNKSHTCSEKKHLMDGLYVCEELVPKACHNGACGLCKIKVHSGDFKKLKMNRKHISQEEENDNVLLGCKVFPKSDMEIEFIKKEKSKEKSTTYVFGQ